MKQLVRICVSELIHYYLKFPADKTFCLTSHLHFCQGTLTSITNFASSVSRNMERLSFDVEHIQRSEVLRRHKPSHVSEGLRNGLSGLGLSILGAFSTSECIMCALHYVPLLWPPYIIGGGPLYFCPVVSFLLSSSFFLFFFLA